MVNPGLLHGLERSQKIRALGDSLLMILIERLQRIGELIGAGYIKLVDGSAIVHQLQQLNLCGANVYVRRLIVLLVLDAANLKPVKVHLGNVASLEAVAADIKHMIVEVQIFAGQRKHRLGLQRLHKGLTQRID